MKNTDRFVFDTNVAVSAMLSPSSKPGLSLKNAFQKGTVTVSAETFEELLETVLREKSTNMFLFPNELNS